MYTKWGIIAKLEKEIVSFLDEYIALIDSSITNS